MKTFLTVFYIAITINAFSQGDYHTYGKLDKEYCYLLFDNTNLRKEPSIKAELVQKLSIGTYLKIISVTDSLLTINNYENKWCLVSVIDENKKETGVSGYLWGGFLADNFYFSSEDSGVMFLYGISKINIGEYNDKPVIQVRAVKDNVELSKVEFEAVGSLSTSNLGLLSDNKKIKNVTNILQFTFSDDYCGGAFGDVYIFWDKAVLHYVKTLTSGSDAPVFSNEFFYFPIDSEGKEGKIIFHEEAGEYTDSGDVEYSYNKNTEYFWTGCELQKVE